MRGAILQACAPHPPFASLRAPAPRKRGEGTGAHLPAARRRACTGQAIDSGDEEKSDGDQALHDVGLVRMAMVLRATKDLPRISFEAKRYGATRAALPPITLSRRFVVSFTGRFE
jgi:hypothetical protein